MQKKIEISLKTHSYGGKITTTRDKLLACPCYNVMQVISCYEKPLPSKPLYKEAINSGGLIEEGGKSLD